MTHPGLIGAVLYAKDLERIAQFYASVVAIDIERIEKGFAVLGSGPSQLVIVRIPDQIADTIEIAAPVKPREETPLKLVFAVDDIARARGRAAELGGVVKAPEHEWKFEGARVCDGHDPEGNIFQVRQMSSPSV
jgi:predicted enzyme related to lactoylglutathione lyase